MQFEKNGNGTNGASIYGTTVTRNSNYSLFLVDEFKPNDKISFRSQAGITQENVNINNVLTTATQLIGTQTNVNQAGAVQVNQLKTIQLDRGFFVQEEFNYRDIFIATAGLRGDKSSRNGNSDKLYYYPKLSGALNINELPSFKSDVISQLKLRAAYGQSGNFAPFGAIYTSLGPSVYNGTTGSLIQTTRGNETLKPEKQVEFETGVDAGFFQSRLSAEITYYRKRVEDLLLNVQVPASSGFTLAWENVAAIQNKGVEIGLTGVPIATRTIKWISRINYWKNKAVVTRLDVPAFNTGGFGASLGTYRIEKGKSPTQLVGIAGPDDKGKVDPSSGLALFGDAEPDYQMSSSATSLGALAGTDVQEVYVLAPMASTEPDHPLQPHLRLERRVRQLFTHALLRQARTLGGQGKRVTVVTPGPRDLAVMGANLMDPRRRQDVLEVSLRSSADLALQAQVA